MLFICLAWIRWLLFSPLPKIHISFLGFTSFTYIFTSSSLHLLLLPSLGLPLALYKRTSCMIKANAYIFLTLNSAKGACSSLWLSNTRQSCWSLREIARNLDPQNGWKEKQKENILSFLFIIQLIFVPGLSTEHNTGIFFYLPIRSLELNKHRAGQIPPVKPHVVSWEGACPHVLQCTKLGFGF